MLEKKIRELIEKYDRVKDHNYYGALDDVLDDLELLLEENGEELLKRSDIEDMFKTTGNGSYIAEIGPCLYSRLLRSFKD